MIDVRCEWQEPAVLGEGPLWVAAEAALYWVDIVGSRLYRLDPDLTVERADHGFVIANGPTFSPDGRILYQTDSIARVISCTFGGDDLGTLFITTARLHLDAAALERHPLAGSLFSCRPAVRGLATHAFGG